MRLTTCVVLASAIVVCASPIIARQPQQGADVPCNVTAPNVGPYGNHLLSVEGLRPNGTVLFTPGGAGFQTRDGALVMKFGWTLGSSGTLKVTGHRLDGDASPLRASISNSDDPHFKPSFLIFPTPGCWQVNAQIGEITDSRISFVTRVVKIGDGPAGRWNPDN